MMKERKKLLMIVLSLLFAPLLVGIASCGGGSSSPTGPSGPIDVEGVWIFEGALTKNTCQMSVASQMLAILRFYQSGSTVTTLRVDMTIGGTDMYFTYQGTVTDNNVSMAAADPYVSKDGGTVTHFGSGIDIHNIQENSGTGSINFTGQIVEGGNGSCQTIWSGIWTMQ